MVIELMWLLNRSSLKARNAEFSVVLTHDYGLAIEFLDCLEIRDPCLSYMCTRPI